jgi:succinyl-diaminopimelate desuccinylase
MIKKERLLSQLADLVSLETVSATPNSFTRNQIGKALDYIVKNTIQGMGKKLVVKKIKYKGSPSVIISTRQTLKPDIGLSAHVDVAPAAKELFEMKMYGDKVTGRGVADMKFSLPIFMALMRESAKQKTGPSVAMLITSDEEIGSANGARHLAEDLGYRPKLLLVPDGGDNWELVQRAKGALHLKATFTGKSAHASRPWLGDSAIDKAVDFVVEMRRLYPPITEEDWQATTMNVGIINGGKAANQVPDSAFITCDFRFSDKAIREAIIDSFREKLPSGAKMSIAAEAYLFSVDLENPSIKRFVQIVEAVTGKKVKLIDEYGATDGRFFNQYGIPCIVIKPPCGGCHAPGEWLSLKGMYEYYQILYRFVKDWN